MKRKVPFIAALSVLLWGCNSYDYSGDDIMGVKAVISGTIVEMSRAVDATWEENDCVGVTCENNINIPYKYIGNSSLFTVADESQSIYFLGRQNHTLTAYCPYVETSAIKDGCITLETTSEKQMPEEQSGIDFLYATAEAGRSNPSVNFSFTHQMSRVDFKFEGKDGFVLNDISCTLIGLKLKGTFDTTDGTAAIAENMPIQPLTSWIPADRHMQASLILLPQDALDVALQIEMGGKSYHKKIGSMNLKSGYVHPYTITISERDETIYISVTPGEVQGWTEGGRQEINTEGNKTNITDVLPGATQWGQGNSQDITSQDVK